MLKLLDRNDIVSLKSIYLSEDSLRFTRHPYIRADESIGQPNQFCIGYYVDNQIIGFFALGYRNHVLEYSTQPYGILLRSLSVDERFQGKGHAYHMLNALPAFIKTQLPVKVDHIVFGVGVINHKARSLYEKLGYVYTGQSRKGRICTNLIMKKRI